MDERKAFEAAYNAINPITPTRETAWLCWQAATAATQRAATAIITPEAAEDLYAKLHTMSKALESNGIIDEMQDRKAYGAILDAMVLVAKFR